MLPNSQTQTKLKIPKTWEPLWIFLLSNTANLRGLNSCANKLTGRLEMAPKISTFLLG